jgi:hypothetical protein
MQNREIEREEQCTKEREKELERTRYRGSVEEEGEESSH